ncbi:MAG: hypothetical protein EXQ86_01155 [Rhodospirillales bacterium]|nr:hypothetical protein [Rhodospirillales bacterium]
MEMKSSLKKGSGTFFEVTVQTNCRRMRLERSARDKASSTRLKVSGVSASPFCCFALKVARASGRLWTSSSRLRSASASSRTTR